MADIFVITRQHSCARFVDLDTSTKEKVLEKYRDYNTDGFDWWDCVYWDFEEDNVRYFSHMADSTCKCNTLKVE